MKTIGDICDWFPYNRARLAETLDFVFDWSGAGDQRKTYFLFIEEITKLVLEGTPGLDGPLGETIFPSVRVDIRIHASGVLTGPFLEAMQQIDPLGENVSATQRANRRQQLREHLPRVPIPLIDLLLTSEQAAEPWARVMAPGAWYLLGTSDHRETPGNVLTYIGDPDGDETESRIASAEFLLPIRPEHELRLRDIFSLKHLPDAEFEDDEGDAIPSPVPVNPDDDPATDEDVSGLGRRGGPGLQALMEDPS